MEEQKLLRKYVCQGYFSQASERGFLAAGEGVESSGVEEQNFLRKDVSGLFLTDMNFEFG